MTDAAFHSPAGESSFRAFGALRSTHLSAALFVWIIAGEITTELWFRRHETRANTANWTVQAPRDQPNFETVSLTTSVLNQLACDEHVALRWQAADGQPWQAFYFRWRPADTWRGRVRVALSRTHRPDHCLPASGRTLIRELRPLVLKTDACVLSFRVYEFDDRGTSLFVFHSLWEEGSSPEEISNLRENTTARLRAAWDGKRGRGQRSLQLAAWNYPNAEAAARALRHEIPQLLVTTPKKAL